MSTAGLGQWFTFVDDVGAPVAPPVQFTTPATPGVAATLVVGPVDGCCNVSQVWAPSPLPSGVSVGHAQAYTYTGSRFGSYTPVTPIAVVETDGSIPSWPVNFTQTTALVKSVFANRFDDSLALTIGSPADTPDITYQSSVLYNQTYFRVYATSFQSTDAVKDYARGKATLNSVVEYSTDGSLAVRSVITVLQAALVPEGALAGALTSVSMLGALTSIIGDLGSVILTGRYDCKILNDTYGSVPETYDVVGTRWYLIPGAVATLQMGWAVDSVAGSASVPTSAKTSPCNDPLVASCREDGADLVETRPLNIVNFTPFDGAVLAYKDYYTDAWKFYARNTPLPRGDPLGEYHATSVPIDPTIPYYALAAPPQDGFTTPRLVSRPYVVFSNNELPRCGFMFFQPTPPPLANGGVRQSLIVQLWTLDIHGNRQYLWNGIIPERCSAYLVTIIPDAPQFGVGTREFDVVFSDYW